MKSLRIVLVAAAGAATVALLATVALANDIQVIPGVRTKLPVKAIPVVCPFQTGGTQLTFFGRALPAEPAVPCDDSAKVRAQIVAAGGTVSAALTALSKIGGLGLDIQQRVTIRGRLHPDGCGAPESLIPAISLAGPAQGLPDVPLVDGAARFTVTSDQILEANPNLFPAPRPLCPSDIFTITHLIRIGSCCYEVTFTVHNAQ